VSSTISLVCGNQFHLYYERLERDAVYLALHEGEIEVTIRIPLPVWEVIRSRGGANLRWADFTDDQLMQKAENEVDERLANFEAGGPPHKDGLYGPVLHSRDEQIRRGLERMKRFRDEDRRLRHRIEALEARTMPGDGGASIAREWYEEEA